MKKSLLLICLTLAILLIATIIWSNYELDKMYGGQTTVVDHTQFPAQSGRIAIQNAHVLSPDGQTFLPNHSIVFEGKEILSVSRDSVFDDDTFLIDGTGRYVIPGLIDSHVHLFKSQNDLLLYLANGVTSIHEMMGTEAHLNLRDEIRRGRIGPRMRVASNKLQSADWAGGMFLKWSQGNVNVAGENVETILEALADDGYDAVKLGSHLTAEDYQSIQEASRDLNIPLIGHIPLQVEIDDFWYSNQKHIAHIEEFAKTFVNEYHDIADRDSASKFLDAKVADIARRMVSNDVAVVSTLWLTESFTDQKTKLDSLLDAIELEYVNPGIAGGTIMSTRTLGWLPDVNVYRFPEGMTEEEIAGSLDYWHSYRQAHHALLSEMIDKGVRVLAGTDANLPVVVPGFSLHDEMALLAEIGMSPYQALQSATVNPALQTGDQSGRIAPGYTSDLLILQENPLEDIKNTRTIRGVIANGSYFDEALLSDMKEAVKQANERSR